MKKIIFISLSLILLSCSKYQKVLKSTDFSMKYDKAIEFYNKGDFNRALPLLEELSSVYRGTDKSEEISYYYAYCNFGLEDYMLSSYLFNKYLSYFPKGKYVEECNFMSAFCYYKDSPRYSLDSKNTEIAINKLNDFINRFPNSEKVEESDKLINELREKLAKKQFENAKQYHKTENYKSAVIALNNALIDYPNYKERDEILYLILESNYLLAINSISSKKEERLKETLMSYQMFVDNYDKSRRLKDANQIKENTQKQLKLIKNN
ncbi:outer membrane protein assembly factor BamD [Bacteroidota bacterium]|nr:outer membrane protein assembly factor BamD [Bacteroidota bacterium]MDC3129953.1 outer membrane protein assembly factor BamD [Bacteroidota bacterium]MDC3229751.1 outer membrane protein assembly factor BamD [Bacteroidota bacterium]